MSDKYSKEEIDKAKRERRKRLRDQRIILKEQVIRDTVCLYARNMRSLVGNNDPNVTNSELLRELAAGMEYKAVPPRKKHSPLVVYFTTGFPETKKETRFAQLAIDRHIQKAEYDPCEDTNPDYVEPSYYIPLSCDEFQELYTPYAQGGRLMLYGPDTVGNLHIEFRDTSESDLEAKIPESDQKEAVDSVFDFINASHFDEVFTELITTLCKKVPDRTIALCHQVDPCAIKHNPQIWEILRVFAWEEDAIANSKNEKSSEIRELRLNRPPRTDQELGILHMCLDRRKDLARQNTFALGDHENPIANVLIDDFGNVTIIFTADAEHEFPWNIECESESEGK